MKVLLSVSSLSLLLLYGCSDATESKGAAADMINSSKSSSSTSFSLQSALGGVAEEGYLRAIEPREFSFPADHGLHEGFRNEWWYLTGNLNTQQGRRFAYQLTFFAIAVAPQASNTTVSDSAWVGHRVWMAHLALTDAEGNKHYALERFSRESLGLAGVQTEPFKVWLDDWSVGSNAGESSGESADESLDKSAADATFPWQLVASDQSFGLSLQLDSAKPVVLQGDAGLSRKSTTPGNASYYYSMTRLPTTGEIHVGSEIFTVSGNSWLDREWSTSALDADQSGWDWFSLQFDDGQELMYYQLRDKAGEVHPYSSGNWTDLAAQQHPLAQNQIQLEPLENWQSPGGVTYTTAWKLQYNNRSWRVQAVLDNQLMNLSLPYWEGAVDVVDLASDRIVGRGFLEMVR